MVNRQGCECACELGSEMCVECLEDEPSIDELNWEANQNYMRDAI
jgi:hypothetical protein